MSGERKKPGTDRGVYSATQTPFEFKSRKRKGMIRMPNIVDMLAPQNV